MSEISVAFEPAKMKFLIVKNLKNRLIVLLKQTQIV